MCQNAAFSCGMSSDQYGEARDRLRMDVDSYESFLRYMIEVQGQYGINTWIQYSGSL